MLSSLSFPLVWSEVERGFVVRLQLRTRTMPPFWTTLVVDTGSQEMLLKSNSCLWGKESCLCLDEVCGIQGGSQGKNLQQAHWGSQQARGYWETVEWNRAGHWVPCSVIVAEQMEGNSNSQLLGLAPHSRFIEEAGISRFEINLTSPPHLTFAKRRHPEAIPLGSSISTQHYVLPVRSVLVDGKRLEGIQTVMLDVGTSAVLVSRDTYPWVFEAGQHGMQIIFPLGTSLISPIDHAFHVANLKDFYPEFPTTSIILGAQWMAGWNWTFEGPEVFVNG